MEYTCYAELEDGVLAFLHRSDMAWVTIDLKPVDFVSCGDRIEVMILELNEESKRIFQFGFFVKLEWNLSGIVYSSDLSYNTEDFKEGDKLKVRVLNVDAERERIGLEIVSAEF